MATLACRLALVPRDAHEPPEEHKTQFGNAARRHTRNDSVMVTRWRVPRPMIGRARYSGDVHDVRIIPYWHVKYIDTGYIQSHLRGLIEAASARVAAPIDGSLRMSFAGCGAEDGVT